MIGWRCCVNVLVMYYQFGNRFFLESQVCFEYRLFCVGVNQFGIVIYDVDWVLRVLEFDVVYCFCFRQQGKFVVMGVCVIVLGIQGSLVIVVCVRSNILLFQGYDVVR